MANVLSENKDIQGHTGEILIPSSTALLVVIHCL